MKRISTRLHICCMLALLLFLPFNSPAQEDEILLNENQIAELNKTASELYAKAVAAFDRVLRSEGLVYLEQAAAADPAHVHLQLVTAQIALQQARAGYGRSNITSINLTDDQKKEITVDYWTQQNYLIAQKCTQRVLDMKDLPRDLLDWAQNINIVINLEIAHLPRRQGTRKIASYKYALAHSESVMSYRLAEQAQEETGEGPGLDETTLANPVVPVDFNPAVNPFETPPTNPLIGGDPLGSGEGGVVDQMTGGEDTPPAMNQIPGVEAPAAVQSLLAIIKSLF